MEETFADVICEMRDHEAKGIKEAYYGRDEWRRLIDRLERAHGDEIARTRERVRLALDLCESVRKTVRESEVK